MKILLSPAKTFSKSPSISHQKPLFIGESIVIQEKLKKVSLNEIKTNMHLSQKLSETVYSYIQKLGTTHYKAIETYQGQVYKSLDYQSLSLIEKEYIHQHVLIVSGLYGLLRPLDGISFYRLEMQDQTMMNLYGYWNPKFSSFLQKHASNELVLSLCSQEYEKAFDGYPITTVEFVAKAKIHSMALKTLRGHFLKLMAIKDIQTLDELKLLNIDGFIYDEKLSTNVKLTFKKD